MITIKNTLVVWLIFLCTPLIYSQCPAPSSPGFTTTTNPASCSSNGSITVNASGGLAPYLYELSGPINRPTQSSNVFNATTTGNYTVTVTDNCGQTVSNSVTVGGTYFNPVVTATSTLYGCGSSNARITVSVSGGEAPFSFQLVAPSQQTSGVFTSGSNSYNFNNVPIGSYNIQVTDDCGTVRTIQHTINGSGGTPTGIESTNNDICAGREVTLSLQTNDGSPAVNPITYIIYENNSPINGGVFYDSSSTNSTFLLPWGSASGDRYYIYAEDGCGNTTTGSVSVGQFLQSNSIFVCGSFNVGLNAFNDLEPTTFSIISGPTTLPPQSNSAFTNLPPGDYIFQAEDNCGTILNDTTTLTVPNFFISFSNNNTRSLCDTSKVNIRLEMTVQNSGTLTVEYLSSPGDTLADFSINSNSSSIILNDHPRGSYTIKVTNGCGQSYTISFLVQPFSNNILYNLNESCVSSDLTNIRNFAPSHYNDFFLGDELFSIISGPTTYPPQSDNFFNNLPSGTYVLQTEQSKCVGSGLPGTTSLDTIEVQGYTFPELETYGTICNGGNQGQILAEVNKGAAPFTYEILSGPNGSGSQQTSNEFNNQSPGTYQIRTIDACGNSDITGIELTNYGDDNVHYDQVSCASTSLDLYADTLPFANYTWTGPNGFTSNERFVIIDPFTTINNGTYSVNIEYNTCIDTTINILVNPVSNADPSFSTSSICDGSGNQITFSGDTGGTFSFATPPNDLAEINPTTGTISNFSIDSSYSIQYTVGSGACQQTQTQTTTAVSIISNEVITNVNCNNESTGKIKLNTSGGNNLNYSFLWSTGATLDSIANITAGNYTVTINDGVCQKIESFTVIQPSEITITPSIDSVSCFGTSTGQIQLTTSGGTPNYFYNWSNNATTQNNQNLAAGSYTVTVTDNNSCNKVQNITVAEYPDITINETVNNNLCFGDSTGSISTIVSGGNPTFTYTWSNGSNNTNLNSVSSGNYSLTITDQNNCQKVKNNIQVSQPTALTIHDVTVNDLNCNNDASGTIEINTTGGTSSYSYLWSNSSTSVLISNLQANTFTVTVTDNNNCTQTKSYVLNEPLVLSNSQSTRDASCNGTLNGFAKVTAQGGNSGYVYNWSNGSSLDSISGVSAGTYYVTISDSKSCSITDTIVINQPSSLTAIGASQRVNCYGEQNGTATALAFGGSPSYTYAWDNQAANQDSSTAINLTAGQYTVVVTDSNNCTTSLVVTVENPDSLTTNTTVLDSAYCGTFNGNAEVIANGGTGSHSYMWNNNTTSNQLQNVIGGLYIVTVSDANGCAKTDSVRIPINYNFGGPEVNFSLTETTCNESTNATAQAIPVSGLSPYTYSWNTNTGIQDSSTATNLSVGDHSLTITDSLGCYTDTFVTINNGSDSAQVSFNASSPTCYNGNDAAIEAIISNGIAPFNITWSNDSTGNTINNLNFGTYFVTITDQVGCITIDSTTIQNTPSLQPTINNTVTEICLGDTVNLQATANLINSSYAWSTGDTISNTTITPQTTTIFTVSITSGGCTETAEQEVIVNSLPTVTFSDDLSVCSNQSTSITAISNATIFEWNTGENSPTLTIENPNNNIDYIVTVTDTNNCKSSNSNNPINLNVFEKPTANFNIDTSSWFKEQIEFVDSSSSNVNAWNWNFDDGNYSDLENPINVFENTGNYNVILIVTDVNGCNDTTNKTIEIEESITIPNVFSPNGDGINDFFTIPYTGNGEYKFEVYNRWGQILFMSKSDRIIWDGNTISGEKVSPGTYYYIVEITNGNKEIKNNGSFTLVR